MFIPQNIPPPAYTQPTLPGGQRVPSSPAPLPGSYTGAPGSIRTDIANALPPPTGAVPTPGGGIQQHLPPPSAPGAQAMPPQMPSGPAARTRRTIGDILAQVMQRGG